MTGPCLHDIAKTVATVAGISNQELRGDRRMRRVSRPRQIAYFMAIQLRPDLSYPQIGMYFHKDHTTVMHGIDVVKGLIARNDDYCKRVIRSTLKHLARRQ